VIEAYASQLIAVFLLSLRIGPALAFAPPFTYLRTPASVRILLSFGLAAWIVAAYPAQTALPAGASIVVTAISEVFVGITLALCLQLAFGAMLTAGRAIDFQVGFGLAVIADPTLRTQMPLVGTLFAYAAGMIFFTTTGPADFLAIWANSVERVPVGGFVMATDLTLLLQYISAVFVMAFGLAGLVLLTLFIVDLAIALMSRTLPQMNVLVLGFQVKTITLLVTLPFVFALSGALILRIVRLAIETTPRLI
jgi:flagellar biosynthesis protein FliR